jgi:hypothetical protein
MNVIMLNMTDLRDGATPQLTNVSMATNLALVKCHFLRDHGQARLLKRIRDDIMCLNENAMSRKQDFMKLTHSW